MMAAAAAVLVIGTGLMRPSAAQDAARGVQMKCQEKYCPPTYQVQVDRPQDTLMSDQSLGKGLALGKANPMLSDLYTSTKERYYRVAHEHPGVRLVAHTVS